VLQFFPKRITPGRKPGKTGSNSNQPVREQQKNDPFTFVHEKGFSNELFMQLRYENVKNKPNK